ncbi:MAG: glycine cleavage system protein GcvH [Myxococcota bacterium]
MIPKELKYTKDHEWVRVEGNMAVVGITHHAQSALGDVVYLELPKAGTTVSAHQPLGVVESVKAVSDIYSPISGKVVESNQDVVGAPQQVNQDPYGKAWMVKIEIKDQGELNALLDAAAYEKLLKDTAH